MNLSGETKDIQSKMAEYCRTGIETIIPDVTPNRFHNYRRLIYSIVQEHLESSFPIAFEFVPKDIWEKMVYDFFSLHSCQSYQVWKIAGEFCEYALEAKFKDKFGMPFLDDLLKFEWEELRLYNMEDTKYPHSINDGDMLSDPIVINPEHILLNLEFPVHFLSPNEAVNNKGAYFVLMYREKTTGNVQFMDISVWHALMIEQFSKGSVSLNDLILEAPKLFGKIDLEELKLSSRKFLNDLMERSFILGFNN